MQLGLRITFALVAGLFLGAIVIQVFLAGVGLFVPGIDTFSYHRQLGWLLHGGPLPVLLLAWGVGAGRSTIWLSVTLLVLVGIQPFLPGLRADVPFAAALHPVNALAIFWLAVAVTRRSVSLALQPVTAPAPGGRVGPVSDVSAARRIP
jgi:hypothetical protein